MKVSEALAENAINDYYHAKFEALIHKAGVADLDLEKDWKIIRAQLSRTLSFNPAGLLGSIWAAYRGAPYWQWAIGLNILSIGLGIALQLPTWIMGVINIVAFLYPWFGNSYLLTKYLRARIRLSSMALVEEEMQPRPGWAFLAALVSATWFGAAMFVDLRQKEDVQGTPSAIAAAPLDKLASAIKPVTELVGAQSPSIKVEVINDNVFLRDPNGELTQLTEDGGNDEAVLSPDGREIAYIHTDRSADDQFFMELRLYRLFPEEGEGNELRILGPKKDGDFTNVMFPSFSPDQKHIYVIANTGVVSGEVYRFELADSSWHGPITAGNSVEILQSGEFKGYMLVNQHRYRDGGGSYEETYLVTPTGTTVYAIPGSRYEPDADNEDQTTQAVEQWKVKNL